jgi:hypothetical protein
MPDTISTHSSRSARPRENEARRFSNWKPVSRWLRRRQWPEEKYSEVERWEQ